MSQSQVTPYGEWHSPISAAAVAEGGVALSYVRLTGDTVWWQEDRPAEGGRGVVCQRTPDGTVRDVVPPGFNVRSRAHEYGGQAWQVLADGSLVFANFADQRLHLVEGVGSQPSPVTPEPPEPRARRYADLRPTSDHAGLIGVRERLEAGRVRHELVHVSVDGGEPRTLWDGAHFVSSPALSQDGSRLAWISWEHPDMPWDSTRLHVAAFAGAGLTDERVVAGIERREALQQPRWAPDGTLYVVTDRTGWWNLHRVGSGDRMELVCDVEQECGAPLWQFGLATYLLLDGERALLHHGTDEWRHSLLDLRTGGLTDLELPYTAMTPYLDGRGDRFVLVGASPVVGQELAMVRQPADGDPAGPQREVVRTVPPLEVDERFLPRPEHVELPSQSGRVVHAHVHPPTNPHASAPEGTLPPYLLFVHGGPTGSSTAQVALAGQRAFFTSRGIGVVDVDYGGSTGYGRAYRELLRGQWGVVDVADCAAAATALADRGRADPQRLAIRGGSAGGWTTLCCLTRTDVFSAGASYYGVADAKALAEQTHDFESRYLDSLIGPLPQSERAYDERSPLSHVDELSCPVLLLQGLDDPIVLPAQAEAFVAALRRKGLPYAYLAFEGEAHGFRRAESRVRALEAELSFYGQVLGFTPPGVPELRLERPPGQIGSRGRQVDSGQA